jgi:hypothetical protein
VPYIEESVFKRFGQTWRILMGDADMRRAGALESVAANAARRATTPAHERAHAGLTCR